MNGSKVKRGPNSATNTLFFTQEHQRNNIRSLIICNCLNFIISTFKIIRRQYWWEFLPEIKARLFSWLLKTGGDKNLYFRLNKESYQQGEEIFITGTSIGNKRRSKDQAFITTKNDSLEINSAELRFNPESSRWSVNIF